MKMHYRRLCVKVYLEINTFHAHVRSSYRKCSVKRMPHIETLTQVFSCEFCEIFKNNFFTENLRTTASAMFYFYTPWKQYSGSKEMEHWLQACNFFGNPQNFRNSKKRFWKTILVIHVKMKKIEVAR